mgnify:CR=1 FL=1
MLRAAIRPYDICVRYAGDEFIIVLSGCGGEEAEQKRLELQAGIDEAVCDLGVLLGNDSLTTALSARFAANP